MAKKKPDTARQVWARILDPKAPTRLCSRQPFKKTSLAGFERVRRSFDMSDVSRKNLKLARRYALDDARIEPARAKHARRWQEFVYHKHVSIHAECDARALNLIAKRIDRELAR